MSVKEKILEKVRELQGQYNLLSEENVYDKFYNLGQVNGLLMAYDLISDNEFLDMLEKAHIGNKKTPDDCRRGFVLANHTKALRFLCDKMNLHLSWVISKLTQKITCKLYAGNKDSIEIPEEAFIILLHVGVTCKFFEAYNARGEKRELSPEEACEIRAKIKRNEDALPDARNLG